MDKKTQLSNEIEGISKRIGMAKNNEKTIIKISPTKDEKEKCCTLKSGSWEGDEPWFIIDEDEKLHTLVSLDTLTKMVGNIRATQEENFNLKLEKTIWKHIPVDFSDVWTVVMDELRALSKKSKDIKAININLNQLVSKVKKEHPNLFLNIDDFIPSDAQRIEI